MEVRLITGFWEMETYRIGLERDMLVLENGEKRISIALSRLRHISLSREEGRPACFSLETEQRTYEGRFLRQEDEEIFTRKIRDAAKCTVEIHLTPAGSAEKGDAVR